MTIDPDGLVEWLSPAVGTHSVTIRVADDTGAYAEQSYTLIVSPLNRPAAPTPIRRFRW